MNLYKILVEHNAPKGRHCSTQDYLLAENDEQVYDFIDNEYGYNSWSDKDCEGEEYEIYNDKYEIIGSETYKEKMLRLKGEYFDDDYDYCDLYYGVTLYGWELVIENVTDEFASLIAAGVFKVVNIQESHS